MCLRCFNVTDDIPTAYTDRPSILFFPKVIGWVSLEALDGSGIASLMDMFAFIFTASSCTLRKNEREWM
jgi:hypothetical protein